MHTYHTYVNCILLEDCNEEITTPGTELTSPGYPENYPNSQDCIQLIKFNETQSIALKFLDFITQTR